MNKSQAKDMKRMVRDYRHSDLRVLLQYFKENANGKKIDLLQRVNKLIDTYAYSNHPEFPTLRIKTFEISKKNGAKSIFNTHSATQSKSNVSKTKTSASLLSNKIKKVGMQADNFRNVLYCPDVTFKSLPFYDFITELMKPTAVICKSEMSPTQYSNYVFSLTPSQVKQIRESEVLTNECVLEYHQQVLLRFCLAEVTSDQEDNYPPNLVVHVNKKPIAMPSYNVPSNANVPPKRQSRPLDITFACILNPVNMNDIHITWAKDPIHTHCFSIVLANRLSCDTLLKRLRQHCYRHPDHTRALVKEKLAASIDTEISFTCLRICLLCPLSKMKMRIPIRSVSCNHLQCFDAATFLQMNEKKPTWTCPICDKVTRYDSLIVDGLFLEILEQAPNATEIQFLEDGSWKDIGHSKTETKASTSVLCYEIADSPRSSDSKDTIVLESKDEPRQQYHRGAASASAAGPSGAGASSVIDLTADSDEEEGLSPSYEPTIDSPDYLSSASSSFGTPFDLSRRKKDSLKLVETIFQPDLPFLDSPLPPFSSQTYTDPPDLLPM